LRPPACTWGKGLHECRRLRITALTLVLLSVFQVVTKEGTRIIDLGDDMKD
jgi:hypothetical protein